MSSDDALSYDTDKCAAVMELVMTLTAAVLEAWAEMGFQNTGTKSRLAGKGRRKTQNARDAIMAETCSDITCIL